MASDIQKYEQKVVNEHYNLDIYRAKGKSKGKISFKDLTLNENLNYVKYSLQNSE